MGGNKEKKQVEVMRQGNGRKQGDERANKEKEVRK